MGGLFSKDENLQQYNLAKFKKNMYEPIIMLYLNQPLLHHDEWEMYSSRSRIDNVMKQFVCVTPKLAVYLYFDNNYYYYINPAHVLHITKVTIYTPDRIAVTTYRITFNSNYKFHHSSVNDINNLHVNLSDVNKICSRIYECLLGLLFVMKFDGDNSILRRIKTFIF